MRKIIKKQKLAAVLLSIGLAAALSGCRAEAAKDSGTAAEASASQETVSDTAPDTEVASELEETKNAEPLPSKKDDFFEAVNGALLSDWEIAADESYVSQISKMQDSKNLCLWMRKSVTAKMIWTPLVVTLFQMTVPAQKI